jgi:hypothetical protein
MSMDIIPNDIHVDYICPFNNTRRRGVVVGHELFDDNKYVNYLVRDIRDGVPHGLIYRLNSRDVFTDSTTVDLSRAVTDARGAVRGLHATDPDPYVDIDVDDALSDDSVWTVTVPVATLYGDVVALDPDATREVIRDCVREWLLCMSQYDFSDPDFAALLGRELDELHWMLALRRETEKVGGDPYKVFNDGMSKGTLGGLRKVQFKRLGAPDDPVCIHVSAQGRLGRVYLTLSDSGWYM